MNVINVNMLKQLCDKQIKLGNGDKKILLSDDDEGNGYHQLLFSFTPLEDFELCDLPSDINKEEYIILG